MGGPGAGHKSWRAQAARRINIQKARAARKRAPLPWRSGLESRVIEQLVWQWWRQKKEAASGYQGGEKHLDFNQGMPPGIAMSKPAGFARGRPLRFAQGKPFIGRGRQFGFARNKPFIHQNIPLGFARANPPDFARGKPAGLVQNKTLISQGMPFAFAQGKPAYGLARILGVSHTWVNKLVKKFEADPERARRRNGAFAEATLATLERAREETRWQRERGRLRGPMPRRR